MADRVIWTDKGPHRETGERIVWTDTGVFRETAAAGAPPTSILRQMLAHNHFDGGARHG